MEKETLFSKEAKKITLTAAERRGLREGVIAYMEYHPLRMPVAQSRVWPFRYYTKRAVALLNRRGLHLRPLTALVVLLLVVAVPLAAERSLPGDTLYPVKVRFNEGVRAQLLFSPYTKMQWETQRVERRITEARLLVQEGRLTEETENALEETVRGHAATAKEQLAEIRETDASGAAVAEVTLESALDVQSAVLNTELGQTASSTDAQMSGLAAIVRETRDTVASSTDASDTGSYEPLIVRVEENITRIHALSDTLAEVLTETQKTDIQERIVTLEETVRTGREAHDSGNNTTAVALLRDALGTTEKLIAFMSSLDLRSSVSLDALVPKEVPDTVSETPLEGPAKSQEKPDFSGEATSTTTPEQTKKTDTPSE